MTQVSTRRGRCWTAAIGCALAGCLSASFAMAQVASYGDKQSGENKRVVKSAAHLMLQLAIEIDQQVAAGDQADAGERRVLEHTMAGEQHGVTQLLPNPIVIAFTDEEATQPFLGDVGFDRSRVAALARRRERARVEIGAEDLDRRPQIVTRRFLQYQHRNRIGLLAGGATRHPDPDRIGRLHLVEQLRQHGQLQRLEHLGIAEECRDRDQEIAEQGGRLVGVIAQQAVVVGWIVASRHLHAPRHPPHHGGALVFAEIMTGPHPNMGKDAAQRVFAEIARLGAAKPPCP